MGLFKVFVRGMALEKGNIGLRKRRSFELFGQQHVSQHREVRRDGDLRGAHRDRERRAASHAEWQATCGLLVVA